jgi:apolipoprotein D and lipocalin family protein
LARKRNGSEGKEKKNYFILTFLRCVKPTSFNLDPTLYLGTWWEQASYLPSFGDKSYSCIKAQYSDFDGDSIAVNNSYVRPEGDDQVFAWGTGTGEITNPETPNR